MIQKPFQALAWGVALLVGCLGLMRLKPEPGSHRLDQYEFETTRHLVSFVERAARRVETDGENVFKEFRDPKGPWLDSESSLYLFAYDTNGVCLFHPVEMALQGRNLSDLRDVHGKRMIPAIAGIPDRGWVHYCWARPGGFFPVWKNILRGPGPGPGREGLQSRGGPLRCADREGLRPQHRGQGRRASGSGG
ncbi:MAG: hypothetical protein FJ379_05885 [Verrucomicrobia bacterium]|nr:hypothetical protein [Verrucomicrobiota bacterium]